ncbi:MAG: hypothetical protein HOA17_02055 [Candidatus Melainabacteria bacterium]|nr:hypothetical protein [Candidatus Melainabacteria bacterium]
MVDLLKLDNLNSKEFWQNFANDLSIVAENQIIEVPLLKLTNEDKQEYSRLFDLEGYAHLSQELDFDFKQFVKLLMKMHAANLPAVFAFVYDEFWYFQARLAQVVEDFLGEGSCLMPTLWIWHVDAKKELELLGEPDKALVTRSLYSGFYGPHRDKGKKALYEDGSPKILSFWIPLTESTPLNSCIYLVPANRDPTYNTDEDCSWLFRRPDIRALPTKPGDILFWNESVVHWGSRPAPARDLEPRISMGFEYVCKEYVTKCNPTYQLNYIPSFKERLEIIALQFKLYVTDDGFPPILVDFIKSNSRLLKEGREEF